MLLRDNGLDDFVVALLHFEAEDKDERRDREYYGKPAYDKAQTEFGLAAERAVFNLCQVGRVVSDNLKEEAEEACNEAVNCFSDEGIEGGDNAFAPSACDKLVNVGNVGLDVADNKAGAREADVIKNCCNIENEYGSCGCYEAVDKQTCNHHRHHNKAAGALVEISGEEIVGGSARYFGNAADGVEVCKVAVFVCNASDIELVGVAVKAF